MIRMLVATAALALAATGHAAPLNATNAGDLVCAGAACGGSTAAVAEK